MHTDSFKCCMSTYSEDVSPKQTNVSITQATVTEHEGMHPSNCCTAYTVKQCEKIDLSSRSLTWKVLPNMKQGRLGFNPCLFHQYVYLCGSLSLLMETFSPETDSFLPLPLTLPEAESCCLYVHNNCLVVLSSNYMTQFSAGPAGRLLPHFPVRNPTYLHLYQNTQPVLDSDFVFLFQGDKWVSFHRNTGAQSFP